MKNNKKAAIIFAIVLGLAFLVLTYMYWCTPSGKLPTFIPGFQAGGTAIHFKHGFAAFALALLSFVFAWFNTGKKK